jgi:acetolactate synthase-1/2/3 large subunit
MGTSLSSTILSQSDLVIAAGNSLNAVSTTRWTLALPDIVQIDIDPTVIGRYYARQTFGVVADVEAALVALRDSLEDARDAFAHCRNHWIDRLETDRTLWWRRGLEAGSSDGSAGASPVAIVHALREAAPDNTLLIPDAGNPGVWSFFWDVRQPGTYLKPVGFGNMGFAVPAAIAAAIVNPSRPVLALVGDGSLGMTMAELETLARIGGPVCIVVLDDGGYGNIRQEQLNHFGGRAIGVDFGPADYAMVARGLGVTAQNVANVELLSEHVATALRGVSPTLYAISLDKSFNAWTFPSFTGDKIDAI